jgi:hypothetical protein
MSNGNELTASHYMNFVFDPSVVIDNSGNKPLENNQKVRVIVDPAIGQIHIGPNPMTPVFDHFEVNRVLTHRNPQQAYHWAKNDGGAVIVANVLMPSTPGYRAEVTLMVFDAVGNLVYDIANHDNVIPPEWEQQQQGDEDRQLVFYWNGISNDNRAAAPGIYRVIVFLDTPTEQQKFIGNIGIGR